MHSSQRNPAVADRLIARKMSGSKAATMLGIRINVTVRNGAAAVVVHPLATGAGLLRPTGMLVVIRRVWVT